MSDSLPQGWESTPLGQIHIDLSTTVNPAKAPDETFELYSVPNFPSRQPEITAGAKIGSSKQSVVPDTVLLCGINPRLNRVWVVEPRTKHPPIASTEWIPFFPQHGIQPKYLAYFLQQNTIRDFLAARASGVGGSLMRVKASTAAEIQFPVAPSGEQSRIVAEIEKYLPRLDAAVAALKRVQANMKRYRASVLKAACEGRLVPTEAELARKEGRSYEPAGELLKRILAERRAKWEADQLAHMIAAGKMPKDDSWKQKYEEPETPNVERLPQLPEGWTWASFGAIVLSVRSGTAETATHSVTDYPVLRSSAVRPAVIDFSDLNYLRKEQTGNLDNYVREGDVMVTRLSGSIEYVGAAAAVTSLPNQPTLYPDRLFCVRVSNSIDIQFFAHCFRHPVVRSVLERAAKSSAGHQRISIADLYSLNFPLPPLLEQTRITAEIDRKVSLSEGIGRNLTLDLKRTDRLRQAILKRAFEGKLVPQDPNDEPASVLLERIRAERVAKDSMNGAQRRSKRKRTAVAVGS